ncbi:MAG: V-type ATP synthase subunit F [Candidatus Nanohaloarchaea archaeon]
MDKDDRKSIAVIGEEEFTLGFQLAGIQKVFGTENYEQKIEELIERDDVGILVAEESDVKKLPDRLRRRVNESVDPVVVTLSETAEDAQLQHKIQKVIGVDIS